MSDKLLVTNVTHLTRRVRNRTVGGYATCLARLTKDDYPGLRITTSPGSVVRSMISPDCQGDTSLNVVPASLTICTHWTTPLAHAALTRKPPTARSVENSAAFVSAQLGNRRNSPL